MFKVNLEEKMVASKAKTISKINRERESSENLLDQVQNILSDLQHEDENLLKSVGLSKAIDNAHELKQKSEELKVKVANIRNPRIFTEAEIKRIAINYGLRFLPSTLYKGSLPNDLAQKIKEFKALGLEQDSYNYNDRSKMDDMKLYRNMYDLEAYFILAPKKSFELQEKPKDPLFFARLADGTYYLIHKWGNDLSYWRYIKALSLRNAGITFTTILCIIYFSLLILCLKDGNNFFSILDKVLLCLIPTVILGIFVGFIIDSIKDNFSSKNWNSPFK